MTTDIARILPPNSTDLEKRLAAAFDRDMLGLLADAPRRLKTEPQAVILPWLASEWWLAGFVKYHPDLPTLIDEGLPWLMERGTAAAVERVLSWIGMTLTTLEEDGARLSLDPGRIVAHDELPDIVYLIGQSIPAHVDLYRIFHGYDIRPIGLSGPEALDEGLLSDDSGIWINVDGEDVKLSFGMRRASWINGSFGHALLTARGDVTFGRTWYEDRARLSVWHLDSEIVPNRRVTMGQLMSVEYTGIDAHPPTFGRHLNIARSALALDDDRDAFGDLNHGFAGGCDIEMNPFVLSGSALSDHDNDVRHIFIDERFESGHILATPALNPAPLARVMRTEGRSSNITRGAGGGWRGGWDSRSWWPEAIRIASKLTLIQKEE
ncbi:MAG: phage tail protein [Zoogloeaceae bacterium]|jgi:hypothetical protein|nr:phage tail protein [Zoogloeaceae bacterium]